MAQPIYIKVEKTYNHTKEQLWENVASNFGEVYKYSPGIVTSNFMGDKKNEVGTSRRCEFPKNDWIEEEITEWNEGANFRLKFIKSSMPMKVMESKFIFEDLGDGKSKLTQELWYRMSGFMGLFSGMAKGKFTKMLDAGLKGLDEHISEK